MLLPYNLGERVWLRMTAGEIVVTVLDCARDDQGQAVYLVRASDGSRFVAMDGRLRPTAAGPFVLLAE